MELHVLVPDGFSETSRTPWSQWNFTYPMVSVKLHLPDGFSETSRTPWSQWNFTYPMFSAKLHVPHVLSETSRTPWSQWNFTHSLVSVEFHIPLGLRVELHIPVGLRAELNSLRSRSRNFYLRDNVYVCVCVCVKGELETRRLPSPFAPLWKPNLQLPKREGIMYSGPR
jgi:hypothetical protein